MSTRNYISLFLIFFLLKDDIPEPKLKFEYIVHNRGDISEGEDGLFFFPYLNMGTAPLVVTDVRSSCGCLVPIYNKLPTASGANDTIFAKYDTKRLGPFNKTITVRTNESNVNLITILRVTGRVLPHKMNEIQVRFQDSIPLMFSEYNKSELKVHGQEQFSLQFTNISNETRLLLITPNEKDLFKSKVNSLEIAPGETKLLEIERNSNATGWYSMLRFHMDNGKHFSIDVLK
jgi:hypothetical protein